jgi:DNA-binding transcriptional MerR regulator
MGTTAALVSIGTVAARLGVTPGAIRKWERTGAIPPAARVEAGSMRRRVWTAQELAEMETTLEERRAHRHVREGVFT